jgi:triosephosphate isomerase
MNPERTPLIAGNWKMNPTSHQEAVDLAQKVGFLNPSGREVAVCPPSPYLEAVEGELSSGSGNVRLGAQDISQDDKGAHTGEVSGEMLKDLGCEYVIVGHSERREAGETDEVVKEKVRAALRNALSPILCVGEKLKERESGDAEAIVTEQLTKALDGLTAEDMAEVVIAYEPVWAIGTGKNATPEDAEGMCSHIRSEIARLFTQAVADKILILYGGSVKPENIDNYMAQPDVDGALVGGAALKAEDFANIVNFDVEEE